MYSYSYQFGAVLFMLLWSKKLFLKMKLENITLYSIYKLYSLILHNLVFNLFGVHLCVWCDVESYFTLLYIINQHNQYHISESYFSLLLCSASSTIHKVRYVQGSVYKLSLFHHPVFCLFLYQYHIVFIAKVGGVY